MKWSRGDAHEGLAGGNVIQHDGSGSDDGALADRDSGNHGDTDAEESMVADGDIAGEV